MNEKLTTSLQESVLTLLVMDDEKGKIASGLVDPELFEPPYDKIAKAALSFRRKFKRAPGEAHIDDLFDRILSNVKDKEHRLYQQVLGAILEQAKGLNADYTLSRIEYFMRTQNLKASILEGAERMQKGGEGVLEETETILHRALKFRPQSVDKGTYLSDKRAVDYLFNFSGCDFYLGVNELDRRNIGLTRGEVVGLLARKGGGKTWACVHVGVMGILQKARVLHISLEMKDQRVLPRYLRRLFAIAKRREKYYRTTFELDDLNRIVGFERRKGRARLCLSDPGVESKVMRKMTQFGVRLNRLHFKAFPTSRLTIDQLVAYMDTLEASDGFVPDILILDYPKLMRLDRRQDLRIALGMMLEELRGVLGERNIAGFFPFQSNREGESVKLITAKQTGEDYSLNQTVDYMLTYSQTRAEKQFGLARLYVDKGRNDEDGFAVLITQDYETGQFVRQSAYMPGDYWTLLEAQKKDDSDDD